MSHTNRFLLLILAAAAVRTGAGCRTSSVRESRDGDGNTTVGGVAASGGIGSGGVGKGGGSSGGVGSGGAGRVGGSWGGNGPAGGSSGGGGSGSAGVGGAGGPGNTTSAGGQSGGTTGQQAGFSKCIDGWPTSGGPHSRRASLSVGAPKVLWRNRDIGGTQSGKLTDGGPVLSGSRIAFSSGDSVCFLNKDGSGLQQLKYNGPAAYPSALVADESGNVYYRTPDGVYSLNAAGNLRWSLGGGGGANAEFATGIPGVLGPDGTVYFATSDQSVSAYRTSDGKVLWSHSESFNKKITLVRVVGGGGKAVFAAYDGAYPDARTSALDTGDGTLLGSFVRPSYGASFTWEWGSWLEGWDLGIGCDLYYVFDLCGGLKSQNASAGFSRSGIIAVGELVAMVTAPNAMGQWTQIALHSTNGSIVTGPAPSEGQPIVAGDDGMIYTYSCRSSAPTFYGIVAYSYDLKEAWRLDLGGSECRGITGNVILDDDGVMYLTRVADGGTVEALAIQTASPGLAESSWPSLRRDNRGTAWLVSGSPVAESTDAGRSEIIDAPLSSIVGD
jgi:hypothetical protein